MGYIAFLNDHMVPELRSVAGNLGITILQGSGDSHDEFLVISRWTTGRSTSKLLLL